MSEIFVIVLEYKINWLIELNYWHILNAAYGFLFIRKYKLKQESWNSLVLWEEGSRFRKNVGVGAYKADFEVYFTRFNWAHTLIKVIKHFVRIKFINSSLLRQLSDKEPEITFRSLVSKIHETHSADEERQDR